TPRPTSTRRCAPSSGRGPRRWAEDRPPFREPGCCRPGCPGCGNRPTPSLAQAERVGPGGLSAARDWAVSLLYSSWVAERPAPHQGDHTVVAARRAGNYRQDPRVPQATGYRDGYVTGGPLCRPGRGGPAQPQEVPMARIGIQLMMLKDHIAEQGVTEVLSRVKETGFRVVEVSQIPMTEENVTAMAAARDDLRPGRQQRSDPHRTLRPPRRACEAAGHLDDPHRDDALRRDALGRGLRRILRRGRRVRPPHGRAGYLAELPQPPRGVRDAR